MWKKIKDNWYFIKQDIISYLIPTIIYITLCLFREFSIHSFTYALFDCLTYYVPFWYIRINFADTYHSDSWKHCKMWTRIMLCSGVIVLWLLPIPYSLFNGLFVAFACCLILYLVAIETNEKKAIIKQNEVLQNKIETLLNKTSSPIDELLQICENKCISERDTKIAVMYYIDRMKPIQIWHWLCDNGNNMELDSVYKLLNRLNKKIYKK